MFVLFSSVSPPGGDFSDPVTSATLGIVQVKDHLLIPRWLDELYKIRCALLFPPFFPLLGVLGFGQEAGSEEALPIRQLAHQLQQIHPRPGWILRQALPWICTFAYQGEGDSAGGRGPGRDCAACRKGNLPQRQSQKQILKKICSLVPFWRVSEIHWSLFTWIN